MSRSISLSNYSVYVHIKNGTPTSIDNGVTPDIEITTPAAFYDRSALTSMIDNRL